MILSGWAISTQDGNELSLVSSEQLIFEAQKGSTFFLQRGPCLISGCCSPFGGCWGPICLLPPGDELLIFVHGHYTGHRFAISLDGERRLTKSCFV